MLLNKRPPIAYIFNKIKPELIYIALLILVVYFFTSQYEHIIPDIPLAIPTFLGTAISVVLSFKLSQSYDRWWEARKVWGSIVNDSRNFVLQLRSFIRPGNNKTIKRVTLRHIGWCYALGQSLRELEPTANLQHYLSSDDMLMLDRHQNKCLGVLQLNMEDLTELKTEGQVDLYSFVQLNNTIVNFTNYMGMCERIKSTVFPVTYRLFLHMIIYVFIVTLSLAMKDVSSYLQIPLLLIMTSFFFLLERTATHLQDPFSNKPTDTAMTAIATTIEINLKQMLNLDDVPEPHSAHDFYIT